MLGDAICASVCTNATSQEVSTPNFENQKIKAMAKYGQILNPDRFRSQHWTHTRTGDGKELITITGSVVIDFKMTPPYGGWTKETLELELMLPIQFPAGKVLHIDQWAPFFTINGFYGDTHATGAGGPTSANHGVIIEDFWGPGRVKTGGSFSVFANIGVSGRQTKFHRIGYHITLVGSFVKADPVRPVM
ncbi:MAG TPA: hypothetical protein PK198_07420 [Saprospiraceae bacterium]|nr:hypothetical protein [Saprospiraceae bacterium]